MKKVFKTLCSVLFATSMAFPANALANQNQEVEDNAEEQATQGYEKDNYTMAFLTGDFGLHYSRAKMTDQCENLVMFLSGPDGKIVKNAQVIATIIAQNGAQQMQRARPLKGGYLVDTMQLPAGQYRMEAEIVTDGWLLTDEFHFQKA